MAIHNICVFCGSNSGLDPAFSEKTVALGQYLAANDYQLVYGGGDHGLMGKVAKATMMLVAALSGSSRIFWSQENLHLRTSRLLSKRAR
nr:hypothetical protein [Lactiplantibacillus plantarum]